jgi:hypothetical protein
MISNTTRVASNAKPSLPRTPSVHTNPARHFVTGEVRKLLMDSSMYRVIVKAFKFQRFGDCVQNTGNIHAAYIKGLATEGIVLPVPDRPGTSTSEAPKKEGILEGARQFMRKLQDSFSPERSSADSAAFRLNYSQKLNPTVGDIEKYVAETGAVLLNLSDILPANEAVDDERGLRCYSSHHRVVVIRTLHHDDGCVYGLCVDGNDLQKNPVMSYITRYAEQRKIPLDELNDKHLEEIQRIIDQECPTGDLHVDQVKFTTVNLTEAVRRSNEKVERDIRYRAGDTQGLTAPPPVVNYPNYIAWANNVQVVKEPIPSLVLDEIRKSIDKNPQYVVFHKFEEE